ncbi:MAG: hypothetical protein K2Y32_08115 [Candidatus Obscuribacterales bacterium]|nr:hypothetical protein [Candidatus Obscuribacterales bacterium]
MLKQLIVKLSMFFCRLAQKLARAKAITAPVLVALGLCLLISSGSDFSWSANPSNKLLQGAFQPNEVVKAVTYCPDCVQSAFSLPIGKKAAGLVKDWTSWPSSSQISVSAVEEFWPRSEPQLCKPGGNPIWLVFRSILI